MDYLEYYGVYVLSQQVEEEPVTDVALADDGVDALLFHSPEILVLSKRRRPVNVNLDCRRQKI